MLNDAGGINKDAAQRVLFIPAAREHGSVHGGAPGSGHSLIAASAQADDVVDLTRMRHPIEIGLSGLSRGEDPAALALPARPGDMLVVPGAGEVVVEGWVDKPGSYKITPGLTVAGAVGAAGGALFASDGTAVTIMRDGADGHKIFLSANLDEISAGREIDIAVLEGDVISIPYSVVKLVPYAAVSLIGRGLYLSAAAPMF
jgi:SLBB domain